MTETVGGHCPTCGAEYRPGFDVCADDGTPLESGPSPTAGAEPGAAEDEPEPRRGVRYRTVSSFPLPEHAHLLAGRLRAEGIEAVAQPMGTFDVYGRGVNPIVGGRIEVLVPEDAVDQARRIIEQIDGS